MVRVGELRRNFQGILSPNLGPNLGQIPACVKELREEIDFHPVYNQFQVEIGGLLPELGLRGLSFGFRG